MKVVDETKKTCTIKELEIGESFTEVETGEVHDLNEVVKSKFEIGDVIKVTLQRVVKEEEE